jgi:hypothetical protein
MDPSALTGLTIALDAAKGEQHPPSHVAGGVPQRVNRAT